MMDPLDYLGRAIEYTEKRGDDNFFRNLYTYHRQSYGIIDSVSHTLTDLYDEDTTLMLKYKYCETVL